MRGEDWGVWGEGIELFFLAIAGLKSTNMEQITLQLKFQTERSSINAETLVKVMRNYIDLIKESNKELDRSPIIITVDAFSEGSFIVNFGVKLKKTFSRENIAYLGSLAAIIGTAFTIINSNDTKCIDNSITINNNIYKVDNSQIINIKENNIITKNIHNIYKNILNDNQIHGFEMSINQNNTLYISEDIMRDVLYNSNIYERKFMTETRPIDFDLYSQLDNNSKSETNASLEVISFPKNMIGIWNFLYNGIIIEAVVDENTIIDNNYKNTIKKGDIVNVEMEISKIWNVQYQVFTNHAYNIKQFN